MQEYELTSLMYRIIDGHMEYKDTKIKDPSGKVLSLGKKKYATVMNECTGLISDTDMYIFLCENNNWSKEKEDKLNKLPKEIEDLKLRYFEYYHLIAERNKNKIAIQYNIGLHSQLYQERNAYYNFTPEGIATGAMWFVMIDKMYNGKGKLQALRHYQNNTLSEFTIRSISQCGEWHSFSAISKNPLGKSSINMTELQRTLLQWTNIYRNVRSNTDCPTEDIFKDHYAFDGWLIRENRKAKAEKKIEVQGGKGIRSDAKNVYVPIYDKKDLSEVMELNTPEAKQMIRSRFEQINKAGKKGLKESEFSFNKK